MEEKNEFTITRIFDAPLDLVWKANTESGHLMQWWGPKGLKMLSVHLDLRPGGIFHYGMESPDGTQMWGKFVYREVVPQEKLVFVVSFSDEKAGITRHPLSQTWPLEVLNIVTFSEEGGKTKLTMKGGPINATEEERKTFDAAHEGLQQGFNGTFDQLEEYLSKVKATNN